MWICPNCGERIEEQFDACWKCGAGREGAQLVPPEAFEMNPTPTGLPSGTPCPVCGGSAYSWGTLLGQAHVVFRRDDAPLSERILGLGSSVKTRLCETCGNLQAFVSEFLEQPPAV